MFRIIPDPSSRIHTCWSSVGSFCCCCELAVQVLGWYWAVEKKRWHISLTHWSDDDVRCVSVFSVVCNFFIENFKCEKISQLLHIWQNTNNAQFFVCKSAQLARTKCWCVPIVMILIYMRWMVRRWSVSEPNAAVEFFFLLPINSSRRRSKQQWYYSR